MLPQAFIQQMCALLGDAEAGALCKALTDSPAPVSIRRNPMKPNGALPADDPVAWCREGYYLAERPSFTLDPLFHAGTYYVQEASSMFVEQAWLRIVRDFTPRRLLDLCAAPGGKSTLWRSLMPDKTLLVANEPIRQRAQILAENLTKWGHPDVVTTSAFPHEFAPLKGFFDVIAADVPCSGEGMFRKDEGARAEWSEEAVRACAERQRKIVSDVWPSLREGGYFVYSTCTFNREENEDNVVFICRELGAEIVPIDLSPLWNVEGDTTGRGLPVCHFFPHRTKGEGLFLALLRKTGTTASSSAKKEKATRSTPPSTAVIKTVGEWITDHRDFSFFCPVEQQTAAVRSELLPDVLRLRSTVRTLTSGILLAETKGKKLIPQHALAMSCQLSTEAFPSVDLDLNAALAYLRRETVMLPTSPPVGHVIVTYEGHPLGFVNHLGTRSNNLYPSEWRIRMS